jgi:AAA+ ATPase superfamily predicted ATPase
MFVARDKELFILKTILEMPESSFVVMYGRRRIGKTETIRYFCKQHNIPT